MQAKGGYTAPAYGYEQQQDELKIESESEEEVCEEPLPFVATLPPPFRAFSHAPAGAWLQYATDDEVDIEAELGIELPKSDDEAEESEEEEQQPAAPQPDAAAAAAARALQPQLSKKVRAAWLAC